MVINHLKNLAGLACVTALLLSAAPIASTIESPVADAAMRDDVVAVRALLQRKHFVT